MNFGLFLCTSLVAIGGGRYDVLEFPRGGLTWLPPSLVCELFSINTDDPFAFPTGTSSGCSSFFCLRLLPKKNLSNENLDFDEVGGNDADASVEAEWLLFDASRFPFRPLDDIDEEDDNDDVREWFNTITTHERTGIPGVGTMSTEPVKRLINSRLRARPCAYHDVAER